jgi:hypothetical protein
VKIPIGRQHGSDGQQTQWRRACLSVDEFEGMLKTPECIWKLGVNEQNIHIFSLLYEQTVQRTSFPFA